MQEPFIPAETADLSNLGDGVPGEQTPEQLAAAQNTQKQDAAFGEFVNSTLGFIAAIGLPQDQFKDQAEKFKQTAEYLEIGKNFSIVFGMENMSPTTALVLGILLFGVTVVASRPDITAFIMKKFEKKQEATPKEKSAEQVKQEKKSDAFTVPEIPQEHGDVQ